MPGNPESSQQSDRDDSELFDGALGADFADRRERRAAVLRRRGPTQMKLAQLLDLKPDQDEATREKEFEACSVDAIKRMQRLRAKYLEQTKSAPPLIDRIQAMIARKEG